MSHEQKRWLVRSSLPSFPGTDVLHLRIDVQRGTPSLWLSCLAMMQGLEESEAVGCAVRQVELHFNSQSRTQSGNDLQIIASTLDAEAVRNITSRPVFATVEPVAVNRTYYLLMARIDSTTLQAVCGGIRSLLSAWDLRNILHFLCPPWYSADEGGRQSIAEVPELGDTDEWDLWKDGYLY